MPSLPAGPVCCCSASLSGASQYGRICLRLIRRRQDSQGRTSECSNASAAVVELNFLISSVPLCCQESGPLQSGFFSHCPLSFHLIILPSITELWGSSYHRNSHVYFLFEHLFRCSITHENYPLYPTARKDCLFLLLVHSTINQCIEQCISVHPAESQYNKVIFSKWLLIVKALLCDYYTSSWLWIPVLCQKWNCYTF